MTPAANPQPIAIVVCDNVYHDSFGKRALVGMFSEIVTTQTDGPVVHPKMVIYVAFTEVYPRCEVEILIEDSESDRVICSLKTPPAPPEVNPTDIYEFEFEVMNLSFPSIGTYFIQFKANGTTMLQRPIKVRAIPNEQRDNK